MTDQKHQDVTAGKGAKGRYKKTKLGWIPVEWEIIKLRKLIKRLESGTSVNCNGEAKNKGDIGILKTSAVTSGSFLPDEIKIPIPSEIHKLKIHIKRNRLLICRKNTPELVGSCVLTDKDYSNVFLPDLLWQSVPNNEKEHDIQFLNLLLNTNKYRWAIRSSANGSSLSMINISKESFLAISIPLPPLPEQQKIAAILSTWDQAIEKLERLIEAKEERKKGLMQGLLTGRVRVTGFSGNRERVKLGDILKEVKKPPVTNPSDFELLTVKLYCKGIEATGKYPSPTINGRPYHFREPGELIIGRQNFHNGGFGIMPEFGKKMIASNAISSFLPKKNVNLSWLVYYFSNPNFYRKVGVIIGGTGQKEISRKEFNQIAITIPPMPEQKAIVAILTKTDQEIDLLKQKLEALQAQKKGLMQQLLTGKTRVKP
jgi:type I restriction enzyme S subunit